MLREKARYNIRYMQCTIIWKIYIEKKSWKDLYGKINSSTFFFLKHLNIFQFLYNEDKHVSLIIMLNISKTFISVRYIYNVCFMDIYILKYKYIYIW